MKRNERAGEELIEDGSENGETIELDADGESDIQTAMDEALASVERDGGPTREVEREDEVARLEAEIQDLRQRTIRTLADFENYRKRVEREKSEDRRYAAMPVLKDLLEVVDNLERALATKAEADDLRTGVEMTLKQARELLRRHGVSEIPAVGEVFDPTIHEAVARHETEGVEEATVKSELQRGYRLHDRLLRPSMVEVAVPAEVPAGDTQESN